MELQSRRLKSSDRLVTLPFRRIVKDFKSSMNAPQLHSVIKSRDFQNDCICYAIASFAHYCKSLFTWRDVNKSIIKNSGIWIDASI